MRRMTIVLAVTALSAFGLASCDDYQSRSDDHAEAPPVEEPHAAAAAESAEPVVAPHVVDPTPTPPPATPPPAEKSSAQSVQPDSETLFY